MQWHFISKQSFEIRFAANSAKNAAREAEVEGTVRPSVKITF